MKYSFVALEQLLGEDPKAYRDEVKRLRDEEPARLEKFVARVTRKLGEGRRHESVRAFILGDMKLRGPLVRG